MTIWRWGLAIMAAGAVVATAQDNKKDTVARSTTEEEALLEQMSGFRVPQYNKDGEKTSEVFGDFARIRPDGIAELTNLKVEYYEDGKVDIWMTSPFCLYDQKKEQVRSEDKVKISRENITVTGKGFMWVRASERFNIYSEAKVVIREIRKQIDGEK